MLTIEEENHIIETLDGADPFLIEALNDKTTNELLEQIERMTKELVVIDKSNNHEWARRQRETISIVYMMYQLKSQRENQDTRGYSIS
jgi:hypothetical protein